MKLIVLLAGLVLLAGDAFAQGGGPVRLTVERGERVNPRTARTMGTTTMRVQRLGPGNLNPPPAPPASTAGIFYHVKVANLSAKTLTNVQVKYAILWTDAAGKPTVAEGESMCDVAPVKICEFDTQTISIRSASKKGTNRIAMEQSADVVGYVVEAYIDGKVVSMVSDPVGIKPRIDKLRKDER